MSAEQLVEELQTYASDSDAAFLQRFFKTSPGEYGEGDVFIGVRVPMTRRVCRNYRDLPIDEISKLLESPVHEHRLAAVIIMCWQYSHADNGYQRELYELYLTGLDKNQINNWDIVDVSCMHIVGAYAREHNDKVLFRLARHAKLWHKRAAIVSCFAWLRKGEVGPTIELAEILWPEQHDLLQKATGWMLREVGKQIDEQILHDFLDRHAHAMPRTTLRYSIERLTPEKRHYYMQLKYPI